MSDVEDVASVYGEHQVLSYWQTFAEGEMMRLIG
jgi:hypothetical protein